MNPIIDEISKNGIVPVVVLEDAKDAEALAEALKNGGLACMEITFRTEAAEEAIRIIAAKYPEILIGAGTVMTVEQAGRAADAGVQFIVSPGFNGKVVRYCLEHNIPVLPGTCGPSDVEAAIELGLEAVKFFPAQQAGGIEMIKAMSAPYTKMKFMPTGGIHPDNLKEYLDFPQIIACGGSWMVKRELIKAGRFDEIEKLAGEAVMAMLGFELKQISLALSSEDAIRQANKTYGIFFGGTGGKNQKDACGGPVIEAIKTDRPKMCGQIMIRTNYITRAIYHLGRRGIVFDEATACRDYNGNLKSIYLRDAVGQMAVQLIQK